MPRLELCHEAESELVWINERIVSLRSYFRHCDFKQLGFSPIAKDGSLLPPPPGPRTPKNIQDRWTAFGEHLAGIITYVKIGGKEPRPLWLKEVLHYYRKTKEEFTGLQQDIVLWNTTLVMAIGIDVSNNQAFSQHYIKTMALAATLMREEMKDAGPVHLPFLNMALKARIQAYITAPIMSRLVPDAASLGEGALVTRVSALFLLNLRRWDRTHGMALPRVRRILEAMAFALEPAFERGVYGMDSYFLS